MPPETLPPILPITPPPSPETLETLTQSIQTALHQAQQQGLQKNWHQVIATCETVIARCHQGLQLESARTANPPPTPASPPSAQTVAAVRACLQTLQQNPKAFDAYSRLRYNLMRYALPAGAPLLQEIAQVCQQILAQQPDLKAAQTTLGYALTRLGDLPAATTCYRTLSAQVTCRQLVDPALLATARRRPPQVLVIGAEKCGTTSLHEYLTQHPAVIPPVEKEIDFFDREYDHGLDWYLAHFPPLPEQAGWLTVETSANYFYSDVAPQRIAQHLPQVKLLLILRHPIDRTVSRYHMMVRNGSEKRSFEEVMQAEMALIQRAMTGDDIPWPVLNRCRHLGNSLYYYHLKRWLALFPREQLWILRSEDLFNQPGQTLQHLYSALGLPDYPGQTFAQHNAGSYAPIDPAIRQRLADFLMPHIKKLEAYLEHSFHWQF
jgi:hypothetical protein